MLRHYSTSRTAVLSIAVPTCLVILGWAISVRSQQRSLAVYLLVVEVALFAYTLALSFLFSTKYEQTRRCLLRIEAGEDVALYNAVAGARLREPLVLDGIDKSLITMGFLLHLAFYVYYFWM